LQFGFIGYLNSEYYADDRFRANDPSLENDLNTLSQATPMQLSLDHAFRTVFPIPTNNAIGIGTQIAQYAPAEGSELGETWQVVVRGRTAELDIESAIFPDWSPSESWRDNLSRFWSYLERLASGLPVWSSDTGDLTLDGQVCKHIQNRSQAKFTIILDVFEEENWPPRIDNPLPPNMNLSESLRSLNKNLLHISFHADGSGEGILWRRAPSR
jgi:hypothetical protein